MNHRKPFEKYQHIDGKIPHNRKDLTGETFTNLTVVGLGGKRDRLLYWECKCKCGNTTFVQAAKLNAGKIRSCGCIQKNQPSPNRGGYKELSQTYWSKMQMGAKHRNLEFAITAQQAYELLEKQQFKCALSGVPIKLSAKYYSSFKNGRRTEQTASLDRIDSSKGYTIDNIQWLHKEVNFIKTDFSQNEIIDWCHKISDYQRSLKEHCDISS